LSDQICEHKERIEKLARERYPQTGLLKHCERCRYADAGAFYCMLPFLAVLLCCLAGGD
jgi:hypothetical protein